MATTIAPAQTLISNPLRWISQLALLLAASAWLAPAATAQTEIYKCTDADGGIVYSQLPCPPPKPVEEEATAEEAEVETVEDDLVAYDPAEQRVTEESPKSEEEIAACKKRYRDAIDVIDAEIGREYTADKGDEYKERLLVLTRKLREC